MPVESHFMKGSKIGLDLLDGTRVLGILHKWTSGCVWVCVDDKDDNIVDIPREVIQRLFILVGRGIDG